MFKRINTKKFWLRSLLVVVILCAAGLYTANRIVKKYGYENLSDFNSTYWHNKDLADQAKPIQLKIELSDNDYKFLEDKRQEALDRGIQINVGDNYVPCTVSDASTNIEAEIRLKGHMTDHLQGDKWSFRIKSDQEIMGMYRFSLQHPGTRGFVYEWVYHQLLKQEDIIHLHYDFVELQLNDKDLGVYAVEEHFGQHVIERNNRPKGAILRWNPSLYWEWRIDELDGDFLDEEYSSFLSSYAEPYDKGTVKDDPELIANYQTAAALLEAFRRDSLSTSEVFDVDKLASFHAIIDLVGGHHSLDWSDIKFYYNSDSKKIEPVGYESFSIRKTERLAGQRIKDVSAVTGNDYHDKLFADPVFFAAYISSLERICDQNYFKTFEESIQEGLNEKLGIIAREWPHRRFEFDGYYENIELIQHNLNLPKPFHAFIESRTEDSVLVSVGAVSDFPVQIDEVLINDKTTIQCKYLLAAKSRGEFIVYEKMTIPYDKKKIKSMVFTAHIPGSANSFKVEVNEYPSYQKEMMDAPTQQLKDQDQVLATTEGKLSFKGKEIIISEPFSISADEELVIFPGQHVKFLQDGLLYCEGKVNAAGLSDVPITIEAVENAIVLNKGELCITNAQLLGDGVFLNAHYSEVNMQAVAMTDFNTFMNGFGNSVLLKDVVAGNLGLVFQSDSSAIAVFESDFKNCDQIVNAQSSVVKMIRTNASNGTVFSKLSERSEMTVWGGKIEQFEVLSDLNKNAFFKSYSGSFEAIDLGFVLNEAKFEMAPYSLYRAKSSGFKTMES